MAQIKAIIFDCFGVIISDALQLIYNDLSQHDTAAAAKIHHLIGMSNRGLADSEESSRQIAGILGLSYAAYRRRIRDGEVKDANMLNFIEELRANYKTAMLSNISQPGLERRFSPGELAKHFDAVIVSGEIGYAKPEPEAYEIAADRLGVRLDECIFIDDREDYCQGARSVGMQALCYDNLPDLRRELAVALT